MFEPQPMGSKDIHYYSGNASYFDVTFKDYSCSTIQLLDGQKALTTEGWDQKDLPSPTLLVDLKGFPSVKRSRFFEKGACGKNNLRIPTNYCLLPFEKGIFRVCFFIIIVQSPLEEASLRSCTLKKFKIIEDLHKVTKCEFEEILLNLHDVIKHRYVNHHVFPYSWANLKISYPQWNPW